MMPAKRPTTIATTIPVKPSEIEGKKVIRIPSVPSAKLLVLKMIKADPMPSSPQQC